MRSLRLMFLAALLFVSLAGKAQALTITFDEFSPVRDNFVNLGITNTYQGFQWSYANAAQGPFPGTGWAVASTTNRVLNETVAPISGDSYAWTWDGPQSLFIDFGNDYDVFSGYFAKGLGAGSESFESNTIQLFGYNNNVQVATSGILNLNSNFQLLNANFSNIDRLEIRADRPSWYLVEDITLERHVANGVVPEPSTVFLLGSGLVGALVRKRKQSA